MGKAAAHVIRTGRVASGHGQAATAFAPAREQLGAYFGRPVHPGTLNILLRRPLRFRPEAAALFADAAGMNPFGAWPVRLLGHSCLVVRWAWCPLHVAELVSPVGFRAAHGLADGAAVSLELDEALVWPLRARSLVAWGALWALNRRGYLDKDYVRTLMDSNPDAFRLAGQPILRKP